MEVQKEVKGSFVILHNNITSLQNSPTIVKDDYICSHNPLRTLEGINSVQGYVLQEFIFQDLSVKNITIKGLQLINIQVMLL